MLLEKNSQDFPNRIQKQRAQFLNNFLKKKWQILETEKDNLLLNTSYHPSPAC